VNRDLAGVCVAPSDSIRDAMRAIDVAGSEIALVVDDGGRLLGTLTDGDVRRALLAGAALEDPVAEHASGHFIATTGSLDRVGALEFMQARGISQLPVLDGDGRVVALHLLRDLLGVDVRPNAAVIMAGGRGRRLGVVTRDVPKPLLAVAGRPILERLVLHLVGSGVRRVFLAVNHLAEQIEAHFGDGAEMGCRIEYLREDERLPLGTGGALALLPRDALLGDEPLLVMNGDLVTRFSVAELCATHARAAARITVAATEHRYEVPFGVLEMEGERVRRVIEKPPVTWPINAGVYAVDPEVAMRIVPGSECTMPDLIADCIQRGETVVASRIGEDWLDVGSPETLRRARGELP